MYRILLCCTSNLTNNTLVTAMKEEAKKNIDVIIWTVAETAIELSWADADCILAVCENTSIFEKVSSLAKGAVPVAMVNATDLKEINGNAVLEQAIKLIEG